VGAATLVLVLAGCRDSGLPGENLPLEEARTKPFRYSTYDAHADLPSAEVDGRTWRAAGPAEPIPAVLLAPVEAGAGKEMFALTTDPAPYTRLYLKTGDMYTPYAMVDGGQGRMEQHQPGHD
jgi:hypothetical protein